jgi:phage shock protein A
MGQVIRSRIADAIRESEDPEKVLEQTIVEMEGELLSLRQSLAEAVAARKRTERQLQQRESAARDWHDRARMALDLGKEELAREALAHWQSYNEHIVPLQASLARQGEAIQNLKKDLLTIERKHAEIKTQKSLYLARLRSADAGRKVRELWDDGNVNPVLEKLEAKVLEMESRAELTRPSDPLERQFQALEGQKQIDAELSEMKKRPE